MASAVGIVNHRDPLPRQRSCDPGRLKDKQDLVVLQRQVHRDRAFFLPGKGIVGVVVPDDQRAVDVTII
jgi:hypothetical protein